MKQRILEHDMSRIRFFTLRLRFKVLQTEIYKHTIPLKFLLVHANLILVLSPAKNAVKALFQEVFLLYMLTY